MLMEHRSAFASTSNGSYQGFGDFLLRPPTMLLYHPSTAKTIPTWLWVELVLAGVGLPLIYGCL